MLMTVKSTVPNDAVEDHFLLLEQITEHCINRTFGVYFLFF